MRPATFKVDGTVYWSIRTYTDAGILVDADSTPTVAVRKNGSATADAVTVTKRAATTGIYDCSWNPASEAEGDCFNIEESATISSQAYEFAWGIEALAGERGTDSALLASDKPTNFDLLAINGSGEVTTANPASGGGSAHTAQDVANLILATPANKLATDVSGNVEANNMRGTDGANTVAPVDVSTDVAAILADTNELQTNQGQWLTATGFSTFDHTTDEVITDAASRNASKADVSGLSTFDATTDQVVASNMRGTDGANTIAPVDVSANVALILADTNELQQNQGQWLTATGFNTVAPDNASIAAILADTNELQQNQGDWATATGFNTVSPDNASIAAILADTNELQLNQGQWLTATGFSTFDHTTDAVITDAASRAASKADVSGLSTFDPSTDQVVTDAASRAASKADVSGLSTFDASTDQVVASNMRGTDNALLASSAPTNWSDLAVEVGTGKVTTANPAAGSGSSHTAQDVADLILVTPANKLATDASGDVAANNMRGTDGANTVTPATVSDLSGLSTFDHTVDQVVASNMRGTDGANTVTPNTVAPDNASITAILNDTNDLQNNQNNWLTANVSGLATQSSVNTIDTIVDAILNDTSDLQSNQGDWLTADVSNLATQASIDALNDFNPSTDPVANVVLVDTTTNLTNGGSGGGGGDATEAKQDAIISAIGGLNDFDPAVDAVARVTLVDTTTDLTNQNSGGTNPADIYTYFTDGTREDAFKADTSGLSTFDPSSDTVARVTLVDTTTDLTNQSAGGVGMFQASVRVQDSNGDALQGARVNVDGTTLSLTTGVNGEVVFNLDSGVYLLNLLPPANYNTPTGEVLTISSSDPSQTVFSLVSTSPPDGCDIPWIN